MKKIKSKLKGKFIYNHIYNQKYEIESVYLMEINKKNKYLSILAFKMLDGKKSHTQIDWEIKKEDKLFPKYLKRTIKKNKENYKFIDLNETIKKD